MNSIKQWLFVYKKGQIPQQLPETVKTGLNNNVKKFPDFLSVNLFP